MVHDVARSILDESTLSDLERSICERFVQIYPQAALSNVSDIYVASFSRWRNDLAQWRCYAAGGSGYCIGFRAVLAARQPGGYVAAKLEQVEYRPEVLRTKTKVILRAVLSEAVNVLKRGPDDQSEVETVALQFMLRQSGALVTRLKDPAFENEAEWRLVAGLLARAPKDTVHFRSTGSGLVPFIELPLLTTKPDDLLDIESVYVGPTHDLESGLRSTKLAVARFGYDPKVVHHSGIPFRGSRW
jgi:hypothetical protein